MDKKKILVVEDEIETLTAIGQYLDRKGYRIFLAKDGQEAYKIAEEVIPDVIITDIIMPNMDGNQLIKKIQESHFGKKISFIVVTVRKNMHDYFESVGVDDFIPKPFTPDQILASVKKVLSRRDKRLRKAITRRVLVVGRSNDCVESMVEQLRTQNCHTDFVLSGDQVISKAVLFLPQVIIMESELYCINAYEVIHILRQMPQFKKTPLVIYSQSGNGKSKNHGGQTDDAKVMVSADRCLEKGATEYIGYYNEGTFLDRISKYISGGSIVIIDDDEGVTRLLKLKLEAAGYKVFAAREGQAGLKLIEQIKPSLILLDVIMPDIDGFKVLEVIKNDPNFHDIPVIMVTVKGREDDVQKGLALGADDYMVKPIYTGLLLKRIKAFLMRKTL